MTSTAPTCEDALLAYLSERGIIDAASPVEDWYLDNWVRVPMFGRRVPLLPVYGFKESLFLHDIHHLLSGYDTDLRGELEIAAWELSSGGVGRYYLYWLDRLFFFTLGLLVAPRRTWSALQRGRGHKNVFGRDPLDVMRDDYAELRRQTVDRNAN